MHVSPALDLVAAAVVRRRLAARWQVAAADRLLRIKLSLRRLLARS